MLTGFGKNKALRGSPPFASISSVLIPDMTTIATLSYSLRFDTRLSSVKPSNGCMLRSVIRMRGRWRSSCKTASSPSVATVHLISG